jgi:hypothetical protein
MKLGIPWQQINLDVLPHGAAGEGCYRLPQRAVDNRSEEESTFLSPAAGALAGTQRRMQPLEWRDCIFVNKIGSGLRHPLLKSAGSCDHTHASMSGPSKWSEMLGNGCGVQAVLL